MLGKVGDGAGQLQNAVIGACTELHLAQRGVDELFGLTGHLAEIADLAGSHIGIGAEVAEFRESLALYVLLRKIHHYIDC